jgi:ZIP family zinc transporter
MRTMPDFVRTVAVYALFPALAIVVGAVLAAFRPPSPRMRSVFQHAAAGVVFAAVAGEVLPEAKAVHDVPGVIIGFAAGVGVMLVVRKLTEPTEGAAGSGESPKGLIVAVGVDLVIDGLLVGIGFAAGSEVGLLVTIALTLEVLFLGLATAAALDRAGVRSSRAIATAMGLGALLIVSAVAGALVLGGLSGAPFAAVLGFGSAALLYLVTEELLVEAHEVPETPMTTAAFFAGFLALLVIEMLA